MHSLSYIVSVSLFASVYGTLIYSIMTDGSFGTFDTDANNFALLGYCAFSQFNPPFSSSIDSSRNVFYVAGSPAKSTSFLVQGLDILSGSVNTSFSLPFLNNGTFGPTTGVGIVADTELGDIYAFGWNESSGTQLIGVNPISGKIRHLFTYQQNPTAIYGYCFDSSTRIFATAINGTVTGVNVDSGNVAYTYTSTPFNVIVCDSENQKLYGFNDINLYSLDIKTGKIQYLGHFFAPERKMWDFSQSNQILYTMNSGYGGDWSLYEYNTVDNTVTSEGNYYPEDFLNFAVYN